MPEGFDSQRNAGNPFVQPKAQGVPGEGGPDPAASSSQPQPPRHGASASREAQAAPGFAYGYQQYQQPAAQPVPIAYMNVPQKKNRGWIVAIVFVVCLFAFSAVCVSSCTSALAGSSLFSEAGSPAGNSIAVIDLDGTIQYDGSACSPEGLKSLLDQAEADDGVKAVVLRVNSGGGTATAGEEMATYVRKFSKPVVISSASINASAAYEISSQADYIYVAKSTEIGAIGTAMEVTDLSGLLDMLGVDIDVIASADSKDSSYGYRSLTEEERAYYQRMVDQINDVFIENVALGRGMTIDEVRALATGLAFTGIDALDNGLADEVGTLEDALDKAAEIAGVTDYTPYDLDFSPAYGLSELYYLLGGQSDSSSTNAHLSSRH